MSGASFIGFSRLERISKATASLCLRTNCWSSEAVAPLDQSSGETKMAFCVCQAWRSKHATLYGFLLAGLQPKHDQVTCCSNHDSQGKRNGTASVPGSYSVHGEPNYPWCGGLRQRNICPCEWEIVAYVSQVLICPEPHSGK